MDSYIYMDALNADSLQDCTELAPVVVRMELDACLVLTSLRTPKCAKGSDVPMSSNDHVGNECRAKGDSWGVV